MNKKISEKDLFGRFYVRKLPNEGRFKNYYKTVNAILPLLRNEEWLKSVTGHYINAVTSRDGARISFFTVDAEKAVKIGARFFRENNLEKLEDPEAPHQFKVSEPYGGEELRFRRFLCLSNSISLEIMQKDLLYARRLFAVFRYQFMKSGKPYENYFSQAFEKKSQIYRLLPESDRKQFWQDMANWPNPPQVDWIHMVVNLVLGWDVNSRGKWKEFIALPKALRIDEVNDIIREQGFEIPGGWRP